MITPISFFSGTAVKGGKPEKKEDDDKDERI